MASDRILTSFSESINPFDAEDEYGSDFDVEQVVASTIPNTQKSKSTDYGSDPDISWNSNIFQNLTFKRLESNLDLEIATVASNYGSDLDSDDEKAIAALLDDAEDLAIGAAIEPNDQDDFVQTVVRVPKVFPSQQSYQTGSTPYFSTVESLGRSTRFDHSGRQGQSYYNIAKAAEAVDEKGKETEVSVEQEPELPGSMDPVNGSLMVEDLSADALRPLVVPSPLDRWRNYRPLAVSDFTAPAWCELQYFFSLSTYGRIRRTEGMKRGSEVHKKLEEEIHEYKPVEVQTKEDAWGLRIWNVIQGLRTLRLLGVTRELDVWGVIDGQIVSGVIDELSVQCPDPEMQEKLDEQENNLVPTTQMTITDFFSQRSATQGEARESRKATDTKIYITDTKTRTSPTLPSGSSLKPVKIQLMLYHHLLSQLANQQVPSAPIFARYKLRPLAPFSKAFLKEMSTVEFNISAAIDPHFSSPTAVHSELDNHPNLDSLWTLMLSEFAITFLPPTSASTTDDISSTTRQEQKQTSISSLLHASFRSQSTGSLIGGRSFLHNEAELQTWIIQELDWWRGMRPARGVDVKEAFKCRICEFAEGCEWRKGKEREMAVGNVGRSGWGKRKG